MEEAYIVDSIRTPIGKFNGSLSTIRIDDLGAMVLNELMLRNPSIIKSEINDVLIGCANQAGEDNRNIARMALLLAQLPYSIPGETINRLCASGMSSVIHGSRMIQTRDANIIIAGGFENMTRGPLIISKSSRSFGRDNKLYDSSFGWRFINSKLEKKYGSDSMGITAENLAKIYKISREDQDIFALKSQIKASKASENGRFSQEIFPIEIKKRKSNSYLFVKDEFIKPKTNIKLLNSLKPAFKDNGTVTAGNSSGINDGAAALILASKYAVNKFNLKPIAKIISSSVIGVKPNIMGIGPVKASNIALKKANLSLNKIDIIEINEAFAAQTLSCMREMGLKDDDKRINPNGGAIAIGHPLGVSGTRIIQTAAIELKNTNKKYALCAMCVGVGQGFATVIENCTN